MSVCAKFHLSSWSRRDWKVWGSVGGEHVATVFTMLVAFSLDELSWDTVWFWQYYFLSTNIAATVCHFCQTPGYVFRLGVNFVWPLSQQLQQQEQEPTTKIWHIDYSWAFGQNLQ